MRKAFSVVIVLMLFAVSNIAFAANWVYLQRLEGTREGPCTEYLDIDSVVRSEAKVTYWTIWVLDEAVKHDGAKKVLFKKEVPLVSQLGYRILEHYRFDSEDREVRRYSNPGTYYHQEPEEISRVLQYVKAGNDSITQPDYTSAPNPKWFGTVELEDGTLYWNINSIAVWPKDNPTAIEIIVKYVWNKDGLERRMNYLKSQKKYGTGFDGLSYTLVNYQFLLAESKGWIISEADYDMVGKRRTFIEGSKWFDIVIGSHEEQARRIALKWTNARECYGD